MGTERVPTRMHWTAVGSGDLGDAPSVFHPGSPDGSPSEHRTPASVRAAVAGLPRAHKHSTAGTHVPLLMQV